MIAGLESACREALHDERQRTSENYQTNPIAAKWLILKDFLGTRALAICPVTSSSGRGGDSV
jgi:hypothetical protein